MVRRFPQVHGPYGIIGGCDYFSNIHIHPDRLEIPLHWKHPRRIFVCSMGDLFHKRVEESFISAVFYIIQRCQQHTFMILTKRPDRMLEFLDKWTHCDHAHPDYAVGLGAGCDSGRPYGYGHYRVQNKQRPPLSNLWLGVTAENQEMVDKRVSILLQIPAAKRFVSVEPMLGPVILQENWTLISDHDQRTYLESPGSRCLSWVICGPETGSGARPMNLDWARSLRDQCVAAGVPFFYKRGKLDGKLWHQFPVSELTFSGNDTIL